jgi:hypothetical protein
MFDLQGVADLTNEMSCPACLDRANKDSPRGVHDNKQGHPWVHGTDQGPMGRPDKGDVMIHKALRFCQVGVCSRRARTAQTRTPSSGASRWTHGFVAPTRDPWGSLGKATCRSGLRQVGKHEARANYVRFTDVAVLPGGAFATRPVRPAPTGTPHGSALAANRDPWVPGNTEEPPGSRQRRRDDPQALVCGEPDARVSGPSI